MSCSNKIIIGVAPTKRSFLSMEAAFRQKKEIFEQIQMIQTDKVKIVDINDICENGILWEYEKVDRVIEKFTREKIDALFIPHCDFGTEEVVGRLARSFHKPTLLWGPRDEEPNTPQSRGRDTQCGIFASSKVLQRYGVTYSYILNSRTESSEFTQGFEKFVRVASVLKTFSHLRIAQISTRPRSFMSVICNEGELLSKFGIEIVPLSVAEIVEKTLKLAEQNPATLQAEIGEISLRVDCSSQSKESMRKIAALKTVLAQLMDENGCAAAALECWGLFPKALGFMPCFVVSELMNSGYDVACETDINGAVTSALLRAAALNETPSFFADLTIRHPSNDNAELLWHCGPFPYDLKSADSKARIGDSAVAEWQLKSGELTIARFDEIDGHYCLFADEAKTTVGPETTGTYVWIEADNWKKWEEKFIFGPYIHHVAGSYGSYRNVLKEACRYIDGLKWDALGDGPTSL